MKKFTLLGLGAIFTNHPFISATPGGGPYPGPDDIKYRFDYYLGRYCRGARYHVEGTENATCLRVYNAGSWINKFVHEHCFVELYTDTECKSGLGSLNWFDDFKMEPWDDVVCTTADILSFRPWCCNEGLLCDF